MEMNLEDKYGKQSEMVKCYVKEIVELPYITSAPTLVKLRNFTKNFLIQFKPLRQWEN